MPGLSGTTAFHYLQRTRFNRHTIKNRQEPPIAPCQAYKNYPEAEKFPLPTPAEGGETALRKVLQQRRSTRKYHRQSISLSDLAFLLWAAQGITAHAGTYLFRTAPSAGALYPVETYLAIDNVAGLAPGLFHLDVREFSLARLTSGPAAHLVAHSALNQKFIATASVVFIWSAILRRNMCKYGERGLRYILMDAGHICQNLLLAAQSLNLAACPIAAFYDDELNELLDLDDQEESVIYLASVGGSG